MAARSLSCLTLPVCLPACDYCLLRRWWLRHRRSHLFSVYSISFRSLSKKSVQKHPTVLGVNVFPPPFVAFATMTTTTTMMTSSVFPETNCFLLFCFAPQETSVKKHYCKLLQVRCLQNKEFQKMLFQKQPPTQAASEKSLECNGFHYQV